MAWKDQGHHWPTSPKMPRTFGSGLFICYPVVSSRDIATPLEGISIFFFLNLCVNILYIQEASTVIGYMWHFENPLVLFIPSAFTPLAYSPLPAQFNPSLSIILIKCHLSSFTVPTP